METGVTVSVIVVIVLVMLLMFAVVAYLYITHKKFERIELNAVLSKARNEVDHLLNEREILLRFPNRLQAIIDSQDLSNNEKLEKIVLELDKYRY